MNEEDDENDENEKTMMIRMKMMMMIMTTIMKTKMKMRIINNCDSPVISSLMVASFGCGGTLRGLYSFMARIMDMVIIYNHTHIESYYMRGNC